MPDRVTAPSPAGNTFPELIAIGFDTSAAHCAAALVQGDRVLAHRHTDMDKGQAECLMPMLQDLLADAGLTWRDLSVIGVGTGPGNFTGIRVAVAAARGLSLALSVPARPVPAVGVPVTQAAALDLPRPCRVAIAARRKTLIWQDFPEIGAPQQTDADALPPGPPVMAPVWPLPVAIARIALMRRTDPGPRPAPVYLRPADAAPARDPAPVILS